MRNIDVNNDTKSMQLNGKQVWSFGRLFIQFILWQYRHIGRTATVQQTEQDILNGMNKPKDLVNVMWKPSGNHFANAESSVFLYNKTLASSSIDR